MDHQGQAGAYSEAMAAAMRELESLSSEVNRLQDRMELIESVVNALEPMLESGEESADEDPSAAESIEPAPEPVHAYAPQTIELVPPQPVAFVASQPVAFVAPQPVARPVSSDPIQRRIDAVLGLAVA